MFVAAGPDLLTVGAALLQGTLRSPRTHDGRLGQTQDLGPAEIHLTSPRASLLVADDATSNGVRVAARLAQLLGGYCEPRLVAHHDPALYPRITPDGMTYDGGYGPSLAQQLPRVSRHLLRYPDSRRAALWLANPPHDLEAIDVPTVFGMQFRIVGPRVNGLVYSRSLDFLNSLSVDAALFAAILDLVAFEIDVPLGTLSLIAGSCHAHSRDLERFAGWQGVTELPAVDVGTVGLRQELTLLRRLESARVNACERGLPPAPEAGQVTSRFAAWIADRLGASHSAHAADSI